jgi:hypothetical protein
MVSSDEMMNQDLPLIEARNITKHFTSRLAFWLVGWPMPMTLSCMPWTA